MELFVRELINEVQRLRAKLDVCRDMANDCDVSEDVLREQVIDICNIGLGSPVWFRFPKSEGGQDNA